MSEQIKRVRDGAVLTLVNSDPKTRNAIGIAFYTEFTAALEDIRRDDSIAAVVVTGDDDFFCSGGNINALRERTTMPEDGRRAGVEKLHDMIHTMQACPKPIIAAVEGGAAGAGISLALACDLIIAARGAYFSAAHVRIGLTPDGGATAFLSQAMPRQLVVELCMTGRRIDAERLYDFGVVNEIVEPGNALSRAQVLAGHLAAGPRAALARIKALANSGQSNSLDAQLEAEAQSMAVSLGDEEAVEGITAFFEKRPAKFPRE